MNINLLENDIKNLIQKPADEINEADQNLIYSVIKALDEGTLRVSSKNESGTWQTHSWLKEAILLYFKFAKMEKLDLGPYTYHDKIPLKKNYQDLNIRVVPPAVARFGSFMEPGVVLMPSYVNIGAYIAKGTMIDTWATVGSCAQVGSNVHVSGGVGIGGVLEPPTAQPVIIENGCFIGSRCILVEGVHVGKEAVLAANCTITASTPIIDTRNKQHINSKGFIPERSVVVPGTKEKQTPGGKIHTNCVYIIGSRKESTDKKTSLNDVLREFSLSV
ncbi:MAG: 2,3,4,5-tetrahydropyridine-2,6-dicarboxylate N-succinyltransferase [Zetaproteobacteria bacterium]|nr:2,3,4,5-tetrahydropyridine-2,6-dicarboxylate N-succinyltransferase [Pseudobdellovibrionaceae bacterium]|tara:strand:- start:243 stop:1067 length:825 start_codon:yes stop_codon:yes gene_type:complete